MEMDWLTKAQACYDSSTTYVDTNYRKKWEYSLRAFQNEHAPGSKYLSDDYKGRSKLFRPKTRSVIRKGEAATWMTVGNLDDMQIGAEDPENMFAVASAEAMKYLLNYRLTKSIPWKMIAAGAYQDASVVGAVCSHNYWEYEAREDEEGGIRTIVKDQPCIDLRPIENIRFDPACKWYDPVGTSPYWIDIIPMYVHDVRRMMDVGDEKTGQKWKKYEDGVIASSMPEDMDSTRQIRQGRSAQDPFNDKRAIADHDVVWVLKYFVREKGQEWCFYTLGTKALLTDPEPIEKVYFHGKRPYTFGFVVLETHKSMPDGPTWMSRDLQREMNDNVNQRMDNVKLILNKRYIVGRGRQVDIASLHRNVPGGVTLATDPKGDVVPLEWNDVTQSAYLEQDKLGQDFDDLVGNFSPNTRFANHGMSETLGGSKLAAQGASAMTEYQIQTLIETWVEPTLRQLILLEQYYETDEKILAIAGQQVAKAFPKWGYVYPEALLQQELVLNVDFGMGATDPQTRLQKFLMATQAANTVVQTAPPGANVGEMIKEIYRNAGYRNGSRFFPQEQGDPRLAKAFQMIQQLQAQLQDKRYEIDSNNQLELAKLQVENKNKSDETRVNAARIDLTANIQNRQVDNDARKIEIEAVKVLSEVEMGREQVAIKQKEIIANAAGDDLRIETDRMRIRNEKERSDREEARAERETAVTESNEGRVTQVASQVEQVVSKVEQAFAQIGEEVGEIKEELQEAKAAAETITKLQEAMIAMANGIASVAGSVDQVKNKPKPKGWKKKMVDGRKSIVIVMDNDEEIEMTEH